MAQNTSNAVMAQRAEPPGSLDFFPTPMWATRALCEALTFGGCFSLKCYTAWEPACGEGHMARTLMVYFQGVASSDVHDHGFGELKDLLLWDLDPYRMDWIITNPPFRLAREFALTALERAEIGLPLLVRSVWLEGGGGVSVTARYSRRARRLWCCNFPRRWRWSRGGSIKMPQPRPPNAGWSGMCIRAIAARNLIGFRRARGHGSSGRRTGND